jgi:hypothetical protein
MTTPPDPALRALLHRADPAANLAPLGTASFAAAVHARIHSASTAAPWHRIPLPGFVSSPPRQLLPLAAALAVLASLGAGSAVAYARERDARADTFAAAFARSIDPWQMHAALPTPTALQAHAADPHAGH